MFNQQLPADNPELTPEPGVQLQSTQQELHKTGFENGFNSKMVEFKDKCHRSTGYSTEQCTASSEEPLAHASDCTVQANVGPYEPSPTEVTPECISAESVSIAFNQVSKPQMETHLSQITLELAMENKQTEVPQEKPSRWGDFKKSLTPVHSEDMNAQQKLFEQTNIPGLEKTAPEKPSMWRRFKNCITLVCLRQN